MLPNFLILGVMKAGTTWLADMLDQHPDIYVAPGEPRFFSDDKLFERGIQRYEREFRRAGSAAMRGEKSVDYILHDVALDRIARALPDVKGLVVLREPIARALSQLSHHARYGELDATDWAERTRGPQTFFEHLDRKFALLERGHYSRQVAAAAAILGEGRVRVIVNELDIRVNATATLQHVCSFLTVDPDFAFLEPQRRVHESASSRIGLEITRALPGLGQFVARVDRRLSRKPLTPFSPTTDELTFLRTHYAAEVARLESVIERPLSLAWRATARGD